MPLSTGDNAPDFTLYDSEAKPFTLSEARQNNQVVLLFFPGAFTSTCTTELNTVRNDYGRYEDLGAEVVGISTDAPSALAEFKKAHGFPFRLLSDHDAEVSEAYDAKFSREEHRLGYGRVAKRAAFVVGTDGTIRYAEVLANAGNQPDYDAILAALEDA